MCKFIREETYHTMRQSLIALALMACAVAIACAAPAPDIAIASIKMDALASGVRVKSVLRSGARRPGDPMLAKASKGGLARDSPRSGG